MTTENTMTKATVGQNHSDTGAGTAQRVFYECGICDCIHPWDFNGDCRDDSNRLSLDDIGDNDELRSMDDRVEADLKGA